MQYSFVYINLILKQITPLHWQKVKITRLSEFQVKPSPNKNPKLTENHGIVLVPFNSCKQTHTLHPNDNQDLNH